MRISTWIRPEPRGIRAPQKKKRKIKKTVEYWRHSIVVCNEVIVTIGKFGLLVCFVCDKVTHIATEYKQIEKQQFICLPYFLHFYFIRIFSSIFISVLPKIYRVSLIVISSNSWRSTRRGLYHFEKEMKVAKSRLSSIWLRK